MAVADSNTKYCSKCGCTKHILDYHKDKSTKDGLRVWCKPCCRASTKNWISNNEEKNRQRKAQYRKEHADKIKAYNAANRDRARAWREANKDRIKEITDAWRKENKDRVLYKAHTRKARKLAVGGVLSKGLLKKLFKLQRGKCACCGLPLGDDYHMDHIMPLALGGTNTDDNIQLLRKTCNLQKHAKHPIDFMQQRGFLL